MISTTDLSLLDIAGPFGAVGSPRPVRNDGLLPADYTMYVSATGRLPGGGGTFGAGRAYRDPSHARLIAVSEAVERRALFSVDESVFTTSSAAELGAAALDLDLVARCSARELRRPGCPLRLPDKTEPIRWVQGVDLLTGEDTFIPAVMCCLSEHRWPAERFWTPISTGAAAHTTIESAAVNGIHELIERDALALTWLQRLPLPYLADDHLSSDTREVVDWADRNGIDTHLFDATTDVGVPTVYCVLTTREAAVDPFAQSVGCGTDLDVSEAATRAIMEAAGVRISAFGLGDGPRRYADYKNVGDGALVMGRRARRPAFDFLLGDPESRPVSRPREPLIDSPGERLEFLLRRLASLDMSVFAVDVSLREIEDAGLVVLHVVIPELQPMSLKPLAQYRAHPRLYEAPARMGMRALPESRLNPYPQPFG